MANGASRATRPGKDGYFGRLLLEVRARSSVNRPRVRRSPKSSSPFVSQRRLNPSYLRSASRESAAPRNIQDADPDGRRQATPVCDQVPARRIRADVMQSLASLFDTSITPENELRNWGRGCNSRRLHSSCYNSCKNNALRPRGTRVGNPPPCGPQAANVDRKRLTKNNLSRYSQNGADSIPVPIRGHDH